VPHNVTFSKCVFLANSAPHGDGGAVYARTSGLGFVIFDDCLFQGNSADFGSGGAVAAVGGRIIFHDSIFVGNVAKNAGAVSLNWGGLVGGCLFSNNVALGGSGGAVFAAQADLNPTETVKNTPNVQVRMSGFPKSHLPVLPLTLVTVQTDYGDCCPYIV
jgi:predicted outer membrane repeat protein|tara:strand:- start:3245 stop:3724 length:480 start_codon:yes stop_codon:yes gene_type:complete